MFLLITVGHIALEVSRIVYFKKHGGVINGHVLTTKYKPYPEGGLEIRLMMTFSHEKFSLGNFVWRGAGLEKISQSQSIQIFTAVT